MGLFWKRKSGDQFVSLKLNEPLAAADKLAERLETPAAETASVDRARAQTLPPQTNSTRGPGSPVIDLEPTPTGAGPTPIPSERTAPEKEITVTRPLPTPERPAEVAKSKPAATVPSRSPFATSVLGLNLSLEELQAQEAALEQEFSARFRRAVAATRETLSERLDTVFQGLKQIDENLLDELEEALIAADIGVATTQHILETVRRGVARKQINDLVTLKQAIKDELLKILRQSEKQGVASETSVPENVAPYVMMVVGVNGVGKTTTIGKLASRIKAEGNDVLICAADTFRAAASDQLAIWAERTGVPLIQQKQGTDPAAVLFDSLKAAKARGSDVLIVDTAGRLHNKSNLMAELEKMKRVAGREVEGAPHETLLVVDAVTGQNGLEQARQFLKVAGVTGIVLTKLDGTAKGGIAVAIANELGLPIRYAGIGEKVDDLVVFDPQLYVNGLFE
ncbi:MAG: fused signal recognition particle receptor [Pyrinomonadaceae bacterium]|jgi:fused signal recognition particle receptor|nr:fused signal recognition particle receptor [Pyrinomonadaceae bacterium]MDQ1729337.1 fused signal recognition particle receptor [Pyrinomonadaceae bacterium]